MTGMRNHWVGALDAVASVALLGGILLLMVHPNLWGWHPPAALAIALLAVGIPASGAAALLRIRATPGNR